MGQIPVRFFKVLNDVVVCIVIIFPLHLCTIALLLFSLPILSLWAPFEYIFTGYCKKSETFAHFVEFGSHDLVWNIAKRLMYFAHFF